MPPTAVLPPPSREQTQARLHLHAVLPALEELVRLVPTARTLVTGWRCSLRLRLPGPSGGTAATLVSPGDGTLAVHRHADTPAQITLRFLSARQLNRTFLNQRALPPLPLGAPWHLPKLGTFTRLARELDAALQPAPGALDDPAYRERHVRLLFRVLLGALPVLAAGDPVSRHSLSHTPGGTAQIRLPALDLSGWVRWQAGNLTAGAGDLPGGSGPDVIITFTDRSTADAALLGRLDANAAVGLGDVTVRGLVPLADGLGVVMDRVEGFLKPPGTAAHPTALGVTAAAG